MRSAALPPLAAPMLAAGLLFLAGPTAAAQNVPVVTQQDTVKSNNPAFPGEAEEEAPLPEGLDEVTPVDLLRGKIAELESRIERLETLLRGITGSGRSVAQAGYGPPTENDPAVAETGVTEEEIQAHNRRSEELEREQHQQYEEFERMLDEQQREVWREIRRRHEAAILDDHDGY